MKSKITLITAALALISVSAFAEVNYTKSTTDSISKPEPIKMVPPRLSDFHYGTEVELEFTVKADGTVSSVRPVGFYFQIERVEVASKMETALQQWKFNPATDSSGRAVDTRVRMPVVVSSEGISFPDYRVMPSANVAQSESEVSSDVTEG